MEGTTALEGVESVEVLVVEASDEFFVREGVEVGEVGHHAGGGVDRAAHGYFDDVVVAVAVGVVAFAEDGAVLLVGVGRGVQAVRGADAVAAMEDSTFMR